MARVQDVVSGWVKIERLFTMHDFSGRHKLLNLGEGLVVPISSTIKSLPHHYLINHENDEAGCTELSNLKCDEIIWQGFFSSTVLFNDWLYSTTFQDAVQSRDQILQGGFDQVMFGSLGILLTLERKAKEVVWLNEVGQKTIVFVLHDKQIIGPISINAKPTWKGKDGKFKYCWDIHKKLSRQKLVNLLLQKCGKDSSPFINKSNAKSARYILPKPSNEEDNSSPKKRQKTK